MSDVSFRVVIILKRLPPGQCPDDVIYQIYLVLLREPFSRGSAGCPRLKLFALFGFLWILRAFFPQPLLKENLMGVF